MLLPRLRTASTVIQSLLFAAAFGATLASVAEAQNTGRRDDGARTREGAPPQVRGGGGMDGSARVRPPGERDEWRLGVTVDALDVGVRIRNVERGSAADAAGLESGDTIVTVGGYQVGRVEGRTFSLEDELQRQADRNGRVRLLVQNRRNNQLLNMDVPLRRGWEGGGPGGGGPGGGGHAGNVIHGVARLPDGGRPVRDPELRVRLLRQGWLGDRVVTETIVRGTNRPDFDFSLSFDPSRVDRNREHEVEIELLSAGRVVYTAPTTRVRLDRNIPRIDVELQRR